jgi:CBS domain-containing protein
VRQIDEKFLKLIRNAYQPSRPRHAVKMTAVDSRVVDWILSSGRRSAALQALAAEGIMSAAQVSRRSGRTVQNASQALKELEREGLAQALGEAKRSWRSYRLTESGWLVASRVGAARSPAPREGRAPPPRDAGSVRDLFQAFVRIPPMASPDEPLERVMARIMSDPATRNVYVVDRESHMIGRIALQKLLEVGESNLKARRAGKAPTARRAADLAQPCAAIHPSDTVEEALAAFRRSRLDDLPLLNSRGVLLGEVNGREVLRYISGLPAEDEGAPLAAPAGQGKRVAPSG